MGKSISPNIRVSLWKLAQGDVDLYRLYLLDLLLEFFDIDEDKPYIDQIYSIGVPENIFSDEEQITIVKDIQDLFSTAPRGTRGVRGKIKERLLWFIRETGESQKRILEATKLYIQECNDNNTYALTPQNFIYKSEYNRERKLEDSTLYEYVQRLDEDNSSTYLDLYAS